MKVDQYIPIVTHIKDGDGEMNIMDPKALSDLQPIVENKPVKGKEGK